MGAPEPPGPAALADALRLLADVMIPGDDLFPPASRAGAHGLLAERLRETAGPDAVADLVLALDRHPGDAPFAAQPAAGRVRAVEALERADPARFARVRSILYYSYYQHPLVVEAVRRLGFAYNDAPQPDGYALPRFDPRPGGDAPPSDTPGRFLRTEEIVRIDLTGIPEAAGLAGGGRRGRD